MIVISVVNSEPLLRESGRCGRRRGGVLVMGGGFAGGYVARLLGRARRDDRQPRELHALHADAPGGRVGNARATPRGRAAAADVPARGAAPRPRDGDRRGAARRRRSSGRRQAATKSSTSSSSSRSAPSHGSLPVPGLAEHALGFKDLADAIHLRNHVLRELEAADAELDPRARRRTSPSSSSAPATRASRRSPSCPTSSRTRSAGIRACATCRSAGCSSTRRRRSCRRSRRGSASTPPASSRARRRDPTSTRRSQSARRGEASLSDGERIPPTRSSGRPASARTRCSASSDCRSTSAAASGRSVPPGRGPRTGVGARRLRRRPERARRPSTSIRRPASTRSARPAGWRRT